MMTMMIHGGNLDWLHGENKQKTRAQDFIAQPISGDKVRGPLYFYFTECCEDQPSCLWIQCPLPGTDGWLDPTAVLSFLCYGFSAQTTPVLSRLIYRYKCYS